MAAVDWKAEEDRGRWRDRGDRRYSCGGNLVEVSLKLILVTNLF